MRITDWVPNNPHLPRFLQITSHSPNFPDPLMYPFFLSTSVAHQNITPLLLGSVQPWSVHFLYSTPLYLKGKTHFLSGSLFVCLFQFFLVLHSKRLIISEWLKSFHRKCIFLISSAWLLLSINLYTFTFLSTNTSAVHICFLCVFLIVITGLWNEKDEK